MRIHTIWLRRIHKWIGLIIGIQFLLWALSGAVMALLNMEEVAGGSRRAPPPVQMAAVDHWPLVREQLGEAPIAGLSLRPMLDRQVYEVRTPGGIQLFDAATGESLTVDAALASRIAIGAYPDEARVFRVTKLNEVTLAVRGHELPIWRVDFSDQKNSSYYVSASTGALLARRNDTWRLWDFFWMLHIMDYSSRTSFNHPLIITVGFAAVWLAISGLYLLFRTGWQSDFKVRRRR